MKSVKKSLFLASGILLLGACGNDQISQADRADSTEVSSTNEVNEQTENTEQDSSESSNQEEGSQNTETIERIQATEIPQSDLPFADITISLDEAVQIFHDEFGPGVNIDEVQFDYDDGFYRYEFSGWDQARDYDLKFDAQTGEIFKTEIERDDDTDSSINFAAIISPQEAMSIALDALGREDLIDGWDLEVDDGVPVYEIDFKNADDIEIHAENGSVLD